MPSAASRWSTPEKATRNAMMASHATQHQKRIPSFGLGGAGMGADASSSASESRGASTPSSVAGATLPAVSVVSSGTGDPRVDEGQQQVDPEVHHDHRDRRDQRDPLDGQVVRDVDGGDQLVADA